MTLLRALHAEMLKLKRTLAFRMVFIAPLLVALLQFLIGLNQKRIPAGFKLWEAVSQNTFSIWAIFMLPLLVALETALLAGIEHGDKQWKHMLALPIPRYTVYAAKLLIATMLTLLSTLVLCVLIVLAGYGLIALRAEFASAGAPNYGWIAKHASMVWLASWLIIAIHTWIAIRWPSMTVALGAGVGGTFFALFAASARVGKYYPWLLPVNTMGIVQNENRLTAALILGGAGGVLAAILGCIEFVRRDVDAPASFRIRRKPLLIGATALLLLTAGAVALRLRAGQSVTRAARVENGLLSAVSLQGVATPMKLSDRMAYYHVPGVSIAVINNHRIEWAKGYGVLEAGTSLPVTTETRFQAASISKPVAATAALVLVEQGTLALDENVNAKLRSWKVPDNEFTRTEKVTLRRLLSHTAGLDEHKNEGYESTVALPAALQLLGGKKPAFTPPIHVERVPGSAFLYSGGGFFLAQFLMTEITGKPFPDLVQELVFNKIDMRHSTYAQPLPAEWEAVTARGHGVDGKMVRGRWHLHPEMAAAGLWTTPSDLARFAIELMQSYKGQSNRLLNAEMTRQMLTRQSNQYGLGMLLEGKDKLIGFKHEGANIGYRCAMIAFPETGQGAVVMTNGDHGGNLFNEILRGTAREYNWPNYRPVARTPVPINPAVFAAYVGSYEVNQTVMTVQAENGRLYLLVPTMGGQKIELHPLGENRFFMVEEDAEFSFVKDERGAVIAMRAQTANEDVTAPRVN